MDCLINLVAFCLLDPSKVYVRAEMYAPTHASQFEGRWCKNHWCRGPMGVLRLGIEIDITRELQLDVGYQHQSDIQDFHDRGEESPYLSLTWRPWRR